MALARMGATAEKAGDSFTVQEWAARLATKAGPRDYVGQLRALYDGILKRWRYVAEPGERVPGTPRAVLGYTLGAKYNQNPETCPHPEHCDIEATPWRERGWGDCDDVATLAAAGVIALGMTPAWRVVEWPGGAHVSVAARTPRGEVVNLDPVGHPSHGFGWALDSPRARVQFFTMRGTPAPALDTRRPGPMTGPTYLGAVDEASRSFVQPRRAGMRRSYLAARRTRAPHVVLTRAGDTRGARLLAVPRVLQARFLRGEVYDGAPAVDQYGEPFQYLAGADVWAPADAPDYTGMGRRGWFKRLRRRVRKFRKRVFRRVRKRVARIAKRIGQSRIAKLFRKAKAKILGSRIVQGLVSGALQAFGVPRAATRALMEREVDLAKRGGRSKLIELAAKGKWKQAAKIIGKTFVAGAKGAIPHWARKSGMIRRTARKLRRAMSGSLEEAVGEAVPWAAAMGQADADNEAGVEMVMVQDGATYHVAPVAAMLPAEDEAESMGCVGMGCVGMGQLDPANMADYTSTEPRPGYWYTLRKGDSLLAVVKKAYGRANSLKNAKMVNEADYNQRFQVPSQADFTKKYIGPTIVSFFPRYDCEPEAQRLQEDDGGLGDGGCYATIWLPSAERPEPPPPIIEPPVPPPPPPPPPVPPKPEPKPKECPAGTVLDPATQECVPVEPPPPPPKKECPPGQKWDAVLLACVAVTPKPPPPCKPGFVRNEAGICARPCPPGTVVSPRADPLDPAPPCVPGEKPACPPGQRLDLATGQCVPMPQECPPGQVWDRQQHKCRPVKTECPSGQIWNALKQRCVQDPAACPPGTVYNVKQGRCVEVVEPPPRPEECPPGMERNAAGVCARPCPEGFKVSPRASLQDPSPPCVPIRPKPGPVPPRPEPGEGLSILQLWPALVLTLLSG